MISGRRRTIVLGAALLVSLGANFFLGGMLLSRPEPRGGFVQQLSEDDRAVVKREFDARREVIDARRAQLRQASQAVRSALQAPSLDSAALEKALAEMRRANIEYRTTTHEALVAAAAKVTPDGRARMAEAPFLRRAERDRERRQRD